MKKSPLYNYVQPRVSLFFCSCYLVMISYFVVWLSQKCRCPYESLSPTKAGTVSPWCPPHSSTLGTHLTAAKNHVVVSIPMEGCADTIPGVHSAIWRMMSTFSSGEVQLVFSSLSCQLKYEKNFKITPSDSLWLLEFWYQCRPLISKAAHNSEQKSGWKGLWIPAIL